jgi:replication factor C subunit 1
MDLSTLQSGAVSVCGLQDAAAVSSFLSNKGIKVLPMCNAVRCLIAGSRPSKAWKRAVAEERGIPLLSESELFTLPVHAAVKEVEADLWVDKYKPRSLKDIVGNTDAIAGLVAWLRDWSLGNKTRGALISGPPGIGKTSAVHLACAAAGYGVVEFNASDARSASAIRAIFADAAGSGCVGARRAIVMDEVDGMSSGDRGGVGALAGMIRGCAFPVICIANERGGPRLKPLVSVCVDIRFNRPVKSTIAKALYNRIVAAEGLKVTAADLEMMCERNGNDIRAILNFLQFSYGRSRTAGAKDEMLRVDAFTAAGRLFGYHGDAAGPKYNVLDTRMNYVFLDHGMVPLMVGEAYAAAAGRGRGSDVDKLAACASAAEDLSVWERLDARIHRSQAWGLLPSAAACVVKAALDTHGPAPFELFPKLLGKMSKRGKIRRAQADLRRRSGFGSEGDFLDQRELMRAYLFRVSNPTAICDTLDSFGMTRDDMFETLSETVFTGDEKTVAIDSKLKAAISREMGKRAARLTRVKDVETLDDNIDYDSEDGEEEDPYTLEELL